MLRSQGTAAGYVVRGRLLQAFRPHCAFNGRSNHSERVRPPGDNPSIIPRESTQREVSTCSVTATTSAIGSHLAASALASFLSSPKAAASAASLRWLEEAQPQGPTGTILERKALRPFQSLGRRLLPISANAVKLQKARRPGDRSLIEALCVKGCVLSKWPAICVGDRISGSFVLKS